MERIIKVLMTALTFLTFMGAFAVVHGWQDMGNLSIRESLLDEKRVDILCSIDKYYTFIVGRIKGQNEDELKAAAKDDANVTVSIRRMAA